MNIVPPLRLCYLPCNKHISIVTTFCVTYSTIFCPINCSTIGILLPIVDSIQKCPVVILLPTVTLHIIAYRIWFLSLCECSTPFNCSTIGILLPIVDSIKKYPVVIVTHRDSSHSCISHLVPFPYVSQVLPSLLLCCPCLLRVLILQLVFRLVSNYLDRICLPPSPLRVIKMCLWNTIESKLGSRLLLTKDLFRNQICFIHYKLITKLSNELDFNIFVIIFRSL